MVGYRAGDETADWNGRISRLEQPVGFQAASATGCLAPEIMGWGEGGWLKAEGLRSTLGREIEKKEKPQQGGCYRAGDNTGNWEAGRRVRVTYLW